MGHLPDCRDVPFGIDADQRTNPMLPNTDAVIRDAAIGLTDVEYALKTEEVRALVLTSMGDLREYAYQRFDGHEKAKFRKILLICKAARVSCPCTISLYADAHAVELQGLLRFKFVTPKLLLELKPELVVYFPIAKSLPDLSISTRDFLLAHKQQLPTWFSLVRRIWLIQPSSAMMMERASSVMNSIFGAQQTTVLNYLFELLIMLRHNRGVRSGTRNDAADEFASSGGAAGGDASASSTLEIDSRSESSCSEDSKSDDDESESDNRYAG